MTARIEVLDWDSDFFGVPIGRAALGDATAEVLASIDAEGRELGLSCLYGAVDSHEVEALVAVQHSPWILADVGIVLARDPALPFEVSGDHGTARLGTPDDVPQLGGAVERLAPWSRYAMDPRFGLAAANRLLHAWIQRAADPAHDRWALHVVEDASGITSFLTVAYEPHARIDLIGAMTPGSGSTDTLMQFTLAAAQGHDKILGGPIAARNLHALRYSERCGYRITASQYNFHRWLDEAGSAP